MSNSQAIARLAASGVEVEPVDEGWQFRGHGYRGEAVITPTWIGLTFELVGAGGDVPILHKIDTVGTVVG